MKRWYKYIKPYLPYFILGPICMIVEVIGEVIMPKLLSVVINGADAGTLTVGGSLGICGLMILTALLTMGGGVGGAYFGAKASVNFATDVQIWCAVFNFKHRRGINVITESIHPYRLHIIEIYSQNVAMIICCKSVIAIDCHGCFNARSSSINSIAKN